MTLNFYSFGSEKSPFRMEEEESSSQGFYSLTENKNLDNKDEEKISIFSKEEINEIAKKLSEFLTIKDLPDKKGGPNARRALSVIKVWTNPRRKDYIETEAHNISRMTSYVIGGNPWSVRVDQEIILDLDKTDREKMTSEIRSIIQSDKYLKHILPEKESTIEPAVLSASEETL